MRVRLARRRVTALAVLAAGLGAASSLMSGVATAAVQPDAASWAGPIHKLTHSTSTNWAGYAVTGGRYTSVSASWTQPAVNCSVTPSGWSSFWVGLDGDGSGTVEQTGTEADCSSGKAVYSAWYEMYPKFPANFSNPVAPGDHFTASVTTNGSGSFTLTLSDTTKGWTQTTSARLKSAKLASAEVIAEAPSSSGGVLPLADFGTASFSGATANGTSFGSLSGLDRINMVSGSTTKASTSTISGGSFSVTWQHS
jgi:Peptidase A4 family